MWMRLVRTHGQTSQKIRRVVDRYRRHDLSLIEQAPGFLGIAMGENHVGGSIASVTCWEDERSMRETDRLSAEARQRALSVLDDPEPMLVDRFEVTFASRLAQLAGASTRPHMRLVRFSGLTRESIDQASACYCRYAEHEIAEIVGIEGVALGINYEMGSLAVVSFWDSERNLRATERLSQQVRDRATVAAGLPPDPLADRWALVDRFELTLTSRLERLADLELEAARPTAA